MCEFVYVIYSLLFFIWFSYCHYTAVFFFVFWDVNPQYTQTCPLFVVRCCRCHSEKISVNFFNLILFSFIRFGSYTVTVNVKNVNHKDIIIIIIIFVNCCLFVIDENLFYYYFSLGQQLMTIRKLFFNLSAIYVKSHNNVILCVWSFLKFIEQKENY